VVERLRATLLIGGEPGVSEARFAAERTFAVLVVHAVSRSIGAEFANLGGDAAVHRAHYRVELHAGYYALHGRLAPAERHFRLGLERQPAPDEKTVERR
jgi:hypothetical protein